MGARLCGLLLWLLLGSSGTFYFPGLVPTKYCDFRTSNCQSSVEVFVNKLNSLESVEPYKYDKFDFCQDDSNETSPETLGQVLFGEKGISSPYKFSFKKEETCEKVCVKSYDPENKDQMSKLNFLKKGIKMNYHHHWVIDDMPVAWCFNIENGRKYCTSGFPIGCFNAQGGLPKNPCTLGSVFNKTNALYLFNHVDITVIYHRESDTDWDNARLVGSRVNPKSYDHSDKDLLTCNGPPMEIPEEVTDHLTITYTYSVKFEENKNVKWASRWDYILEIAADINMQWFSVINSLFVVLSSCGLVITIMVKSYCKDFARYYRSTYFEREWRRLVWSFTQLDIFRPPQSGMFLSVFLGEGAQIFIMCFFTLFLAGFGFLTRADRGILLTCAAVLWVLLGTFGGYVSGRLYKTMRGVHGTMHYLLTALLFPGAVFADFFIMNLILWMEESSAAVPFDTLITFVILCLGITAPAKFLGVYLGRRKPFQFPVHRNVMPIEIPTRSLFTRSSFVIVVGTALPFSCIFIQLFHILNSIWSPHMYYLFGFLFLVFITILIVCTEVTVLVCYFRLGAEDFTRFLRDWWWRAFLTSSFTSFFLFVYLIYCFYAKVQVTGIASTILYFGYMMILVLIFFLFTGTIGFFFCFWFITTIDRVIRMDQ